ncbi:MAG: histidine kinase [Gammaproteobacteria bacterium]|nr:histidine kinase [Gammaproteobacteria bacterium]
MTEDRSAWGKYTGSGQLNDLLKRSPILRLLVVGRLLGPLGVLVVTLLLNLLLALAVYSGVTAEQQITGFSIVIGVVSLVAALIGAIRLRSQLLKPLVELEQSVADVCEGEPWSNLPLKTVGVLGSVTRDLDSLSGELIDLYEDMDDRVARQTRRLAQQTSSLKILYDIAASITQVNDMDELLMGVLRVVKEMLNGKSASVQLASISGEMRLVASIGPDDRLLKEKEQLPVVLCQCGKALSSGDILCEQDAQACSRRIGRRMYGPGVLESVTVPFAFHGTQLGVFRIYVLRVGQGIRKDLKVLLRTIGNHLATAIAKQRSDEEAYRLSIIEERTTLANELHDSLAQTLASLRYQVRMLDETLETVKADSRARSELDRIRTGLDEAHIELRELLNSFRAPLDQRGLVPALMKLTQRFRQETGVPIFFQRDCRQVALSAGEEMQMLRIVQECLANIRKHARAHNVRVLLSCNTQGEYRLLVEDDGMGFDAVKPDGNPGEHIGLSIMEERAKRLGASIRVESEPGEGTRVELIYRPGSVIKPGDSGPNGHQTMEAGAN